MFSAALGTGRVSVKPSIRSINATTRSTSVRISVVSSRPSLSAVAPSSCAAPRMPDSGFLISWASIAAMPIADRAAFWLPRWRSTSAGTARG